MGNILTVASNIPLEPAFTMPVNFVGTWVPSGVGNSVFGAPVVVTAEDWKTPPPGAGPTIIPTCDIQTPKGLVFNSPLGQIPVGTPVMSQGKVYLGILGFEPGQVNPSQWANAVAPAWLPLLISPVIPCEVPMTATTTPAALAAKVQADAVQLLADTSALVNAL